MEPTEMELRVVKILYDHRYDDAASPERVDLT